MNAGMKDFPACPAWCDPSFHADLHQCGDGVFRALHTSAPVEIAGKRVFLYRKCADELRFFADGSAKLERTPTQVSIGMDEADVDLTPDDVQKMIDAMRAMAES